MSSTPKPYPVVYDANTQQLQYDFQTGWIQVPGTITPSQALLLSTATANDVHNTLMLRDANGNVAAGIVSGNEFLVSVIVGNGSPLQFTGGTGNVTNAVQIVDDTGSVVVAQWDTLNLRYDMVGHTIENVGALGTTVPVASAVMDLGSTTQGVLIPRMTTTQKNAISSPAEGLQVYDLTLHALCLFNGTSWLTVTAS